MECTQHCLLLQMATLAFKGLNSLEVDRGQCTGEKATVAAADDAVSFSSSLARDESTFDYAIESPCAPLLSLLREELYTTSCISLYTVTRVGAFNKFATKDTASSTKCRILAMLLYTERIV